MGQARAGYLQLRSERDAPGPKNNSAPYSEIVEPALRELRELYRAFGAEQAVKLKVTPGRAHEMEVEALAGFLA